MKIVLVKGSSSHPGGLRIKCLVVGTIMIVLVSHVELAIRVRPIEILLYVASINDEKPKNCVYVRAYVFSSISLP